MIALPPVLDGAVNATLAEPFPRVADTPVGAPGTVAGTNDPDGVDADPDPTAFDAVTVHV